MDEREVDLVRLTRIRASSDVGEDQGGSEDMIGAGDARPTDDDVFMGTRVSSGSLGRLGNEDSDSLLAWPLFGLSG
jgi:hypothetical protein